MPAAANPPRFHVVTYAKHEGHDAEDVVAEGTVQLDAPDKGTDLVEGILSHVDQFVCDGHGQGTNGCTEEHDKAVERIRARLTDEDGKVAVICRKYHPLVGRGVAEPGKPFEAKWDGVAIRVEVRQVVDDPAELLTDDSVSMVSLRQLQQDFAPKVALANARMRVRSKFSMMVDTSLAAVDEQIAEYRGRLADLPDQDEVGAASDAVTAAAQAIVDKAQVLLTAALENEALTAADAKAFAGQIDATEQEFAQIFGPFLEIEQKAAQLIATQEQVRTLVNTADDILQRAASAREDHKKLDYVDAPVAKAKKGLEALLAQTRKDDALDRLAEIGQASEAFRPQLADADRGLMNAVRAAESKAQAFEARVQIHDQWRTAPDEAAVNLKRTLESVGGFAEVPVAYWAKRADEAVAALGDLTDISQLRYDDAKAEQKLKKAENELGPVHAMLDELQADLGAIVGHAFDAKEIDGLALTPPTTWVEVKNDHGDDTFDVELHIVGNDVKAVTGQIMVGDNENRGAFLLQQRGDRISVTLERVRSPVALQLTAQEVDGDGDRVQMRQLDIPSAPMFFNNAGATHYAYPMHWTPMPNQPGGLIDKPAIDLPGSTVTRQRLLGIE